MKSLYKISQIYESQQRLFLQGRLIKWETHQEV